jgi:hypothetical protein
MFVAFWHLAGGVTLLGFYAPGLMMLRPHAPGPLSERTRPQRYRSD